MSKALIVVDVQKDFCEGGALAVEGGNAVAEKIRNYLSEEPYEVILFTKDNHKPWPHTNGGHFSENPDFVDSWPPHCQQGTPGAEMNDHLIEFEVCGGSFFLKGDGTPDYSGFQGRNDNHRTLNDMLQKYEITEVDIVGIAGDYCVRETALDAVRLGYKVNLLTDMIASVRGDEATAATVEEVENLGNNLQG